MFEVAFRDAARNLGEGMEIVRVDRSTSVITVPVILPLRGGRFSLQPGNRSTSEPDRTLVAALRRAHSMTEFNKVGLPVVTTAPVSPYERRILRLAFLAPDLQRGIITGQQPRHVNLEFLMKREIPANWTAQRAALDWAV